MVKVLFLLKQGPDKTAKTIIDVQKTLAEVVSSDKIITW
jgi:hypothetical protein